MNQEERITAEGSSAAGALSGGNGGLLLAYLAPVALLAVLRVSLWVPTWDDAYISFKTAENLSSGHGMVFNIGEPLYAVTTPLWVILLALVRLAVPDVVLAAKCLGACFECLCLCSVVALGRRICGSVRAGAVAAVLLCLNPVFLLSSFSGMELPLYLFLICLALNLLLAGRYAGGLFVSALVVWTRVDGFIFFVVAMAWWLWRNKGIRWWGDRRMAMGVALSLAAVAGYLLFGMLYYGDCVPVSLKCKAAYTPALFSSEWVIGALTVYRQFLEVFVGKLSYWFIDATPYWILVVPLIAGCFAALRFLAGFVPLLAFTGLYAALFIASGSLLATNFPWYFVPVLPGLYLLTAAGGVWILEGISRRIAGARAGQVLGLVSVALLATWIALLWPVERRSARLLQLCGEAREREYAATVTWLNACLPSDGRIAMLEIGAGGFAARPDIRIMDLFGILRVREDRALTGPDMVRKYRPEAIVNRCFFDFGKGLDPRTRACYAWHVFRGTEIGIRKDLWERIGPRTGELPGVFETLDLRKKEGDGRAGVWE